MRGAGGGGGEVNVRPMGIISPGGGEEKEKRRSLDGERTGDEKRCIVGGEWTNEFPSNPERLGAGDVILK